MVWPVSDLDNLAAADGVEPEVRGAVARGKNGVDPADPGVERAPGDKIRAIDGHPAIVRRDQEARS